MRHLLPIILLLIIGLALHFVGALPNPPHEVQRRPTFAEACRAHRSDYCREFFEDLAHGRRVRAGLPSHKPETIEPPPGIPIEDFESGDSD
jgi:hypothetical protein